MAELVRNDQTGEYALFTPESGLRPISEEEAEALQMGRVERTGKAALDTVVDSVGGVMASNMLNPIGAARRAVTDLTGANIPPSLEEQAGEWMMQQNDPRQQGIGAADPLAAWTGFGVGMAAEGLIPGGPAVRGSRAARAVAEAAPASPTAARGMQNGSAIVNGVTGRVKAVSSGVLSRAEELPGIGTVVREVGDVAGGFGRLAEDRRVRRSLSAAGGTDRRYRPGIMRAEELEEFTGGPDILQNSAVRAYLEAPDAETSQAMQALIKEQSLRERTDPGIMEGLIAGRRESLAGTYADMRDATNRKFMEEIGSDPELFPDISTLGENLTRISGEITGIEKKVDFIDSQGLVEDVETLMRDNVATADTARQIERVKEMIVDLTDDQGLLNGENLGVVRNRIEDAMRRKAGGPDTETVEFLSDVREKILDRMQQRLEPADIQRDRELRKQWGWTMSALNRQGAIGENGVNPTSLLGSRGVKSRATKTGRDNDTFTRFLRTVDALNKVIPSSSQTPEALSRRR